MFVDNMISNAVNSIHTAYLGRVLQINGNKAKVQPLSKYQEVGQEAGSQAVVSAYITNQAQYILSTTAIHPITQITPIKETKTINGENISYVSDINYDNTDLTVVTARELQVGDVVICAVCERDISGQTEGQQTVPDSSKNYSLSNSVIIGVI